MYVYMFNEGKCAGIGLFSCNHILLTSVAFLLCVCIIRNIQGVRGVLTV